MKLLLAKISFLAVILVAISSCTHDECKDVTCPVYLECSHGSCVCPNGYQGTNCDTLSFPKYIGTYQVEEIGGCTNFPYPYNVSISWPDDTLAPGEIWVSFLFQQAPPAELFIINIPGSLGLNFTIPAQIVGTGTNAITFSGTGSALLNGQNAVTSITLELNYTAAATGQNYSCTELMDKF